MDRAARAVKESILLSVTMMSVGGIAMAFAAPSIVGVFSDNPVVLEQGVFYLRLITLSIPLMGIFQSIVGCFQGAGHTVMAMFITTGTTVGHTDSPDSAPQTLYSPGREIGMVFHGGQQLPDLRRRPHPLCHGPLEEAHCG